MRVSLILVTGPILVLSGFSSLKVNLKWIKNKQGSENGTTTFGILSIWGSTKAQLENEKYKNIHTKYMYMRTEKLHIQSYTVDEEKSYD